MADFRAPRTPAHPWAAHLPASAQPATGGGCSFRRIVVPVDILGRCAPALTVATELGAAVGGSLRLVHVRTWEPPIRAASRFFCETSEEATALLEESLAGAWAAGATASGVIVDAPRSRAAAVIAGEADSWGAEVIVVARRPRNPLGALLLGSLSQDVLREARCPVVVVQPERATGASPWATVR